MSNNNLDPLAQIRRSANLHYLTVKPEGFVLEANGPIVLTLRAEILGHGGARTLYRARRPHCRSLNGVHAIQDAEMLCGDCFQRQHCTPQVRIDLLIARKSFVLLLSHTSARRFLNYVDELRSKGLEPEAVTVNLRVINRGKWGEVDFAPAD
jgi:hypothetical protein